MTKNTKNQSLSNDLATTIAKTGGVELPAEILEFTIDQVIDESIFKEIPIVGWLAKGVSITRSISDRIFHHKILRFLIALEKVSESKREKFRANVENDPNFRRKVGEHLLLVLNKIDAFEKTTLLAKCFDHFLTEDIDYQYFVDLSSVIERTPLSDLCVLSTPPNKRMLFSSVGVAAACGILEYGISDTSLGEDTPELGTKMSKYGKDLRDIFLGKFRERKANEKKQREALFGKDV